MEHVLTLILFIPTLLCNGVCPITTVDALKKRGGIPHRKYLGYTHSVADTDTELHMVTLKWQHTCIYCCCKPQTLQQREKGRMGREREINTSSGAVHGAARLEQKFPLKSNVTTLTSDGMPSFVFFQDSGVSGIHPTAAKASRMGCFSRKHQPLWM